MKTTCVKCNSAQFIIEQGVVLCAHCKTEVQMTPYSWNHDGVTTPIAPVTSMDIAQGHAVMDGVIALVNISKSLETIAKVLHDAYPVWRAGR